MSPSIPVSEQTKSEWDELKPDSDTHDDFARKVIDAKKRDDGQIVNPDKIVDEITQQTAAEVELAAFRGTRDAITGVLDNGD